MKNKMIDLFFKKTDSTPLHIREHDTNNLIVQLEESFLKVQRIITIEESRIYCLERDMRKCLQI